jgi:hypothetical protein
LWPAFRKGIWVPVAHTWVFGKIFVSVGILQVPIIISLINYGKRQDDRCLSVICLDNNAEIFQNVLNNLEVPEVCKREI